MPDLYVVVARGLTPERQQASFTKPDSASTKLCKTRFLAPDQHIKVQHPRPLWIAEAEGLEVKAPLSCCFVRRTEFVTVWDVVLFSVRTPARVFVLAAEGLGSWTVMNGIMIVEWRSGTAISVHTEGEEQDGLVMSGIGCWSGASSLIEIRG